jgi:hypothetical protein
MNEHHEKIQHWLNSKHIIRFNWFWVIFICLIFGYGFQSTLLPFPPIFMDLTTLALAIIGFHLYRDLESEIHFEGWDFLLMCLSFTFLLFLHWPWLFFSLAGDELHHAMKSNFILDFVSRISSSLPEISNEQYLSSMWNKFDLRRWPVVDVWRALSLIVIVIVVGASRVLYRSLSDGPLPAKRMKLVFWTVLLLFVGYFFRLSLDYHPPLRLLPLLISQGVLGLDPFAFRLPSLIFELLTVAAVVLHLRQAYPEVHRLKAWIFSLVVCLSPPVFFLYKIWAPTLR